MMIIFISGCHQTNSPDTGVTPLEGSWKTIGIYSQQYFNGFIDTYTFHDNHVCMTAEMYSRKDPLSPWLYAGTSPLSCSEFTLDKDYILFLDTNNYSSMPFHYSIDNAVLTLNYGFIFNGTSDTLKSSIWTCQYLNHYNGSSPVFSLFTLTFINDSLGKFSEVFTGSTVISTVEVQYQPTTNLIIFNSSSYVDSMWSTATYEIVNKKLYVKR